MSPRRSYLTLPNSWRDKRWRARALIVGIGEPDAKTGHTGIVERLTEGVWRAPKGATGNWRSLDPSRAVATAMRPCCETYAVALTGQECNGASADDLLRP